MRPRGNARDAAVPRAPVLTGSDYTGADTLPSASRPPRRQRAVFSFVLTSFVCSEVRPAMSATRAHLPSEPRAARRYSERRRRAVRRAAFTSALPQARGGAHDQLPRHAVA